jgi:ABC-type methionine transport system permease subunit
MSRFKGRAPKDASNPRVPSHKRAAGETSKINLRSASVIGFVGAGGIGEELYKVISFNYYEEISAIIVLVILAVVCIDLLSEKLRRRVIEAVS